MESDIFEKYKTPCVSYFTLSDTIGLTTILLYFKCKETIIHKETATKRCLEKMLIADTLSPLIKYGIIRARSDIRISFISNDIRLLVLFILVSS